MRINRICQVALTSTLTLCPVALAQSGDEPHDIRAHIRLASHHLPLGQPVWALFSIENASNEPVMLAVPDAAPRPPEPQMGLPISHVFSSGSAAGVTLTTESGRRMDRPVGYWPPNEAPIVTIAPHSTVGTTIDLRSYFPVLRGAGLYRVSWEPYGGQVLGDTVSIVIAPRKQVEIVTDEGMMAIQLFYEDAPAHVANFLDLAQSGFYTGKTFHRLEPGYMLQGGCSIGDGTGIRPDGKRVPAEFNNRPHQKGSVSMALLEDDPNSGSCQFFICNTRQTDWDGRYTVFGQLVDEASLETLDKLMATPVDECGRPTRTLYMRSVRVVDTRSGPTISTPTKTSP